MKKHADKRNVRSNCNQGVEGLLESIDKMFKVKTKRRFHVTQQSLSDTRLLIENNVVTSEAEVTAAWATHFEQLGSSKLLESPVLQEVQSLPVLLTSK